MLAHYFCPKMWRECVWSARFLPPASLTGLRRLEVKRAVAASFTCYAVNNLHITHPKTYFKGLFIFSLKLTLRFCDVMNHFVSSKDDFRKGTNICIVYYLKSEQLSWYLNAHFNNFTKTSKWAINITMYKYLAKNLAKSYLAQSREYRVSAAN